jgi:enoyl-CoA hydratase/carnithine racemase
VNAFAYAHPDGRAPTLRREDADGVTVVTFSRPDTRNSLSLSMLRDLTDILAAIAADSNTRAVILAADGPAFCAGHDLKEMMAHRADADGGRAFYTTLWEQCSRVMLAITRLPQPVIACVQGPATGAGCQLVATCDLAVASETAKFSTPGVNFGLFCSTPMVALSRNLSRKHAMEMLLTGEFISAVQAERFGLVNRVVPPGTEGAAAMQYARQIATKSPIAVRLGKQGFYAQLEMDITEAYGHASTIMTKNMLCADAKEGIAAFLKMPEPNRQK